MCPTVSNKVVGHMSDGVYLCLCGARMKLHPRDLEVDQ